MLHTPSLATRTHFHRLNPETLDGAVLTHLRSARNEFRRAATRKDGKADWSLKIAGKMMGLACLKAERAALLRGHRFDLLDDRDMSIEAACEPAPTVDDAAMMVVGNLLRSVGA